MEPDGVALSFLLEAIGPELRQYLVAGNNESTAELAAACNDWPAATVLHGSSVTLAGQTFFGLGGGVPVTPFGSWSYDFSEEQAAELLRPCPPPSRSTTPWGGEWLTRMQPGGQGRSSSPACSSLKS